MHRSLAVAGVVASWALAGCDDVKSLPIPEYTLAVDRYDPGALLSLWGSAPNDLWTVGGEQGKPLVLHFDGTRWVRNEPPIAHQLWWAHGFVGGPVFVSGAGGVIARHDPAGTWTVFDTGYPGTIFYGIWGAAPNDMYAVGGTDFAVTPNEGDVILHWNGVEWSRIRVAVLDAKPMSAQKDLFKVWGTSAKDVFIVGGSGIILHSDGTGWTQQISGIGNEPLFTVFGRAPNDVYAVGGLGTAILLRYNGTAWSPIELPVEAPPVLQGVWTAPGQPLWVSGYRGFFAAYDGGQRWRVAPPKTPLAFHALFGLGDAVYACGGNIMTAAPDHQGVIAATGAILPAP
ncbi:MAG: hypothetical protein SGI86_04370 [Deltaproteobacteria bacterium]|nr:hypothetical protein [Deltaproteobacteria bacterium]